MTAPAAKPWPGQAHHRLTTAVSYADGVLEAVTPQLLSRPTPCHAWNLRMLLEHAEESLAALHEGVTDHRVDVSAPAFPAALVLGKLRGPGGHTEMHARLGGPRQAGPHASAARPWPSVKQTTVRTDRPNGTRARPLCVRGHRNATVDSVTR